MALSRARSSQREVVISLDPGIRRRLPRLGLGTSSDEKALSQQEIRRLKAMNLAHLRVDLVPSDTRFENLLAQVVAEGRAISAGLEVALFLSANPEEELRHVAELVKAHQPPICSWLIFSLDELVTPPSLASLARESLQHFTPKARFGAGTNAWFYELNSARPAYAGIDLLCYSIQPQVHSFDNDSLVETLKIQGETVLNARKLGRSLPVVISPVTLKPPFNPYATASETPMPDELPPEVDSRQMSLFGAGWTLGSLKYLAEAGAYSVTYFETVGWRGVMERRDGCTLPGKFHSLPGGAFPLYHVLAEIGEYAGGHCVSAQSSEPLQVEVLAVRRGTQACLMIANLSPQLQQVRLPELPEAATVNILDDRVALEAIEHPESFRAHSRKRLAARKVGTTLELLPFALVWIKIEGEFLF